MSKKNIFSSYGIVLAAGSVWGLIEFGAGMGLQKCATLVTGAILTGLSLFWLSFIWSAVKHLIPVIVIVIIAMLFKWLDALLLKVAWNHGSVLNPMFAFFTTLTGFVVFIGIFRKRFSHSLLARILVGGGAALAAMCLFPLVKFVTGSAACTFAATQIPLSIYTAPVAMIIGMVTVPLGFRAASLFHSEKHQDGQLQPSTLLTRLWSPAVFIGCVVIIVMVRII